ncbi:tol-pal system protein YbgF [Nitrosospira sp. Nsp14]|uniref:tol-pal system protein YbgF n=1 Tax=Nitrosospira sp. Nsp14 TaxID=1855333 RepID=UPI0008E88C24|nr:tol-pal system protein YbgF [Nitrosospira sp. Nsp14]SFH37718.1 tol-pal system protein YbgF [Nitrosospira sp. Nsp14]
MRLRAFLLLLLIGGNPAYAGLFNDEEARKQIAAQQALITELRSQVQALEARIIKLDEALSNQPLLDLHNQIEHLRVDLNKLQGQIEVLGNESELTQKRQKDFYIDLDDRVRRIEQHGETMGSHSSALAPKEKEADMHSSVDAGSAPDTDAETTAMASAAAPGVSSSAPVSNGSAAPADSSEAQAYETAYALFKSAKYKDAISHFNKFIKSYPASSYLPSAQYWIGNSYFALRDFKNAITAQEKLLSSYPDSAKAPDAMLNIASSQQEMGKKTAAKKTLETLIARYPGSDAAEKAKRRLANSK